MSKIYDRALGLYRSNTQACVAVLVIACSGVVTFYLDSRAVSPLDVDDFTTLTTRHDLPSRLITWGGTDLPVGEFSAFWQDIFVLLSWLSNDPFGTETPSCAVGTVVGGLGVLGAIARGERTEFTPDLLRLLREVQ